LSVANDLRELEEQLLQTAFRHNRQAVSKLLADDFCEFGSSGRVWNKQQILDLLETEESFTYTLDDFRAIELPCDTALVTYRLKTQRSSEAGRSTLRSSIWVMRDGRWQVLFIREHMRFRTDAPPSASSIPPMRLPA